jgi:hypothetical protein
MTEDHEVHAGGFVWRNGAEMEWECEEFCPHPSHDDDFAEADARGV